MPLRCTQRDSRGSSRNYCQELPDANCRHAGDPAPPTFQIANAAMAGARPARTYEIHEVAELTGLAAARLRAWERRYEVVRPRRLPHGYRAYSRDQVALLRAFARLIDGGERIGGLAARPREDVLAQADARLLDGSPHA